MNKSADEHLRSPSASDPRYEMTHHDLEISDPTSKSVVPPTSAAQKVGNLRGSVPLRRTRRRDAMNESCRCGSACVPSRRPLPLLHLVPICRSNARTRGATTDAYPRT